MNRFIGLFILFLTSCYTIQYVADVNIQYDPSTKIDREKALIYIDTKGLPEGIESRKLAFYLKNSLENLFFRVIQNQEKANVILKIDNRILQKKTINFVSVPEETEVKKSTYSKEDPFFLFQEPKNKTTYTTYKKIPLEVINRIVYLQLSFIKLNGDKKIEAIKAEMEVNLDSFEKNIEIFINKFIEQISFEKEISNTRIIWREK